MSFRREIYKLSSLDFILIERVPRRRRKKKKTETKRDLGFLKRDREQEVWSGQQVSPQESDSSQGPGRLCAFCALVLWPRKMLITILSLPTSHNSILCMQIVLLMWNHLISSSATKTEKKHTRLPRLSSKNLSFSLQPLPWGRFHLFHLLSFPIFSGRAFIRKFQCVMNQHRITKMWPFIMSGACPIFCPSPVAQGHKLNSPLKVARDKMWEQLSQVFILQTDSPVSQPRNYQWTQDSVCACVICMRVNVCSCMGM